MISEGDNGNAGISYSQGFLEGYALCKERADKLVEALQMGAFHHQACDANWYSDQVDEEKVRAGIPDPRKAKDCTCARKKIEIALEGWEAYENEGEE